MMDDELNLRFWKYLMIACCTVLAMFIGSCQSSKYQLRKAVEAGAMPMEAACAFKMGWDADKVLCALIVKEQEA